MAIRGQVSLKTALIGIMSKIDIRHYANGAEREALRRFLDDGELEPTEVEIPEIEEVPESKEAEAEIEGNDAEEVIEDGE